MSRVVRQISKLDSTAEHKETNEEYNLYALKTSSRKPMMVSVMIETQPLEMELDSGADVSLISEQTYLQQFKHIPLQESKTSLRSYSGELIELKG